MATSTDDQLTELLSDLETALDAIVTEPDLRLYLNHQAVLWRYSPGNVLLLRTQAEARGITPTLVAGFGEWKREARWPRKGQPGLRILAPVTSRAYTVRSQDGTTSTLSRKTDLPDGATITDVTDTVAHRFRPVTVWDVTQTDGLPLEAGGEDALPEAQSAARLLSQLQAHAGDLGFTVHNSNTQYGTSSGYTNHAQQEIVLPTWLPETERAAIMAHELAHAVLHGPGDKVGDRYGDGVQHRGLAEVEAEATAYLILRANGIDSTERSATYLAGWSDAVRNTAVQNIATGLDGQKLERSQVLRSTLSRVHAVAKTALLAMDTPGGGKPPHRHADLTINPALTSDRGVDAGPIATPPQTGHGPTRSR